MALVIDQLKIWEWIYQDSTTMDIYGKMFDPDVPTRPSWWSTCWVINESYNYDLSWFQKWNEVCVSLIEITNDSSDRNYWTLLCNLQYWDWSQWKYTWEWIFFGRMNMEPQSTYFWFCWMWIDIDEIRDTFGNEYRFLWTVDGTDYSRTFNTYWFNYDTTLCDAGKMWIDWVNLCYTDSDSTSSWNKWHIHKVAPDSWYSWGNVWSDYAGHIWIPDSSSDHHIYYIDEFWTKRRTNESRQWQQDNNRYVWNQYKWKVWIPRKRSYDSEEPIWYSYLVYVDWAWYVRKQGNWNVY